MIKCDVSEPQWRKMNLDQNDQLMQDRVKLIRTDTENTDFRLLVEALDRELSMHNGENHDFYAAFNTLNGIRHVVIVYCNDILSGCGAIREYAPGIMEVKRMYVPPALRGKGMASAILKELEKWASEMDHSECILETANYLPAAIRLYERSGYERTQNYGQYAGVEASVCMRKKLK